MEGRSDFVGGRGVEDEVGLERARFTDAGSHDLLDKLRIKFTFIVFLRRRLLLIQYPRKDSIGIRFIACKLKIIAIKRLSGIIYLFSYLLEFVSIGKHIT